jgi:hypothetical protein
MAREEHSTSRSGHSGGEAAMHSEKVSAAQLAQYLRGISFPADKQKIISTARSNGAPDIVMQYINKLPQRDYNRANEVEQEFGKMK